MKPWISWIAGWQTDKYLRRRRTAAGATRHKSAVRIVAEEVHVSAGGRCKSQSTGARGVPLFNYPSGHLWTVRPLGVTLAAPSAQAHDLFIALGKKPTALRAGEGVAVALEPGLVSSELMTAVRADDRRSAVNWSGDGPVALALLLGRAV